MTQIRAASADGTRRRSSHSSSGTSAIGDHQSGGDRQEEFGAGAKREGQAPAQGRAGDQGQRGEQPVAAEGGVLHLGLDARPDERHLARGLAFPHMISFRRGPPEAGSFMVKTS